MQLPPFKWPLGQREWEQVYRKITGAGALLWSQIDKTGSSIGDLANRSHSLLQNILGWSTGADTTQNKHISQSDGTKWDDGANQAISALMTSSQSTAIEDVSGAMHMMKQPTNEPATDFSGLFFVESKPTTDTEDITALYWMGG